MSPYFGMYWNRNRVRFAIDLKNVLLVDREIVKLLALSEADGTELRNCPRLYPRMGHKRGGVGNA